jgi:hypothetical protein
MANQSLIQRLLDWPFQGRQLLAMKQREGYTKGDFRRQLCDAGGDDEVIEQVWTILADHAVDGFKPRPENNLQYMFGLAEEDLDEDVILRLLEANGCRIPDDSEVAAMGPVDTVADLVMFVSSVKGCARRRD